ncbi:MAG: beta-lactamase family protein [Saprospiraceae bacterium]|nr:beta-lactamase family protein [Saprospiraceae bacterium]MBK8080179.1 beta-lactamase family protein [Saprospiraceae bacterium]MBK8818083.1 beta-lactamase family protein [Saprospiraceae bacterium]MBK8854031.1 beta-lactamase family protein [Saprospiraceae bacterium]
MKYILTIGLLFLMKLSFGQAQSITKLDETKVLISEIDKKVKYLMEGANVEGVGIAVLNDNKTVFIKSYGYKNKPKNEILDTATIVYGASLSKAVFGYLIMKLVEEKTLDLDKPLYKYLKKPIGEYEYFSDLKSDENWKLITPRMCLSHTTGLPNVRWFHPVTSEQDTLGIIRIYFTPGTKYAYSGEGFKLLQLAVEEITQKNIDELAVEKIFVPFGMTRTGYIWHSSFGDHNVAVGHMNNGDIEFKKKRTVAVSGGSLVTTLADYSRFIEHVMQQKGLRKKLYKEMFSPQISIHSISQFPPVTEDTTTENDAIRLSYGLGWGYIQCSDAGRAVFKEGNGGPWRNYNINFIDKGISIIILVNSENGEKIFQGIIDTLIGDTCIPWKWHGYTPYDYKK